MLTLNRVLLEGTLPEEPKLVYSENRTPQCSFTMLLEENGRGQTYQWSVHIDIFADRAERALSR
jgi:hypothetical protein